ncbi:hypothetical protein G9C85_09165 [Halorubellus sp. JP-L1]|uniref:DUF7504 family protein n=1 Tax=Halorubellus sp. JP-L1 TaxID=2715753 RepID=UPI00140BB9E3|nr:hypothetical protein [Halorubellus sp. JP-L1]NHN41797.1 hypothetical protein [Halorubellus sp. JP-L1]
MNEIEIDDDSCNVLVTTDDARTCTGCLDRGDPGRRAELTVSYPDASAEQRGFGDHGRTQPATKGLISVDDTMRSGAAPASSGPEFTGAVAQDAIADPTNLQRLGTSVSEFCQRWDGEDYDIVVCFDSLTALLEYTSPEVVFQFCHVLTKRLESVDAVAHFHLDPSEHDDQTVATFQSIFDETVGRETQAETMDVDYVEATDDDIAALAEGWSEEASYSIVGGTYDRPDDVTEATDDDIEQTLADRL